MSITSDESQETRLIVRELRADDYPDLVRIQNACFPDIKPWRKRDFLKQLEIFGDGQIGIEMDGKLVAASSSVIVAGADYTAEHTFAMASGNERLENHDPEGDTLYGLDIVVDPEYRGLRLARRIYEERKRLVHDFNLRRIFIGGRLPGYHAYGDAMSVESYIRKVIGKEVVDPVLQSQLSNGFSFRSVLPDYLPLDKESRGYAVLLEWLNPIYVPAEDWRTPKTARVAAAQYQMRPISSFEEFATQCEFFIDTACEYHCDFIVFPELLTNQLLALVPADRPALAARRLDEFTSSYIDFFTRMAIRYNVNIVGGTHLTVVGDDLFNIGYLFRRDGSVETQKKIHITPSEAKWWGVTSGDRVEVFETDSGKVAILICYDIEFPEIARIARSKGANLIFVPYNTDIRSGHLRVRTCAQARCIENHIYCVLSGAVGNLPFVEGADIHYAQSSVLTPSDIPFARDGVGAEATPNVEAMVIHEVDFDLLRRTLRHGSVRPWIDRKTDLYQLHWKEDGEDKSM